MASSVGGTTRRETRVERRRRARPEDRWRNAAVRRGAGRLPRAQANFAYGRLNALIVITDGRNEDAQSVSLERLLDALRLQFDGVRPVRIIAIGYGEQADTANLRRITDITGGRTYEALTADEVESAFAQVLADL